MNDAPIDEVVAEVKALTEAAGAKLHANPHDPETLREMIAAMDAVKGVLLVAGETASLAGCKLLAAMYQNVEDLQAQVTLHLHQVQAVNTVSAMAEAREATKH